MYTVFFTIILAERSTENKVCFSIITCLEVIKLDILFCITVAKFDYESCL